VLERDDLAIAAAVPDGERDRWASILRALARSAAEVADRLTPRDTR
jgi:hypothetical protein